MTNCIIFTGGGTGGHVFPALAVLGELRKRWPGRIVWIGSTSGMERRILAGKKIPYYGIPAGKLRRYLSLRNLLDLFKIVAGIAVSVLIFLRERPVLIFAKGGYVTVPAVIVAGILGIPVFTHESDLDPGLATRINGLFAHRILTSFPVTASFFKAALRRRVIRTGNPVRAELLEGKAELGRKLVGCPPELPLLLVLGGSQGSRFINLLIQGALPELAKSCFVVHQMGSTAFRDSSFSSFQRPRNYHAVPFFNRELPDLLAAADLIICRSGANTLWEIAALGKPSLLIPLSQAASRGDQIRNALFFERAGAALVLGQQEVSPGRLIEIVSKLLDNKSELNRMARAAFSLSNPGAAFNIAQLIFEKVQRVRHGA